MDNRIGLKAEANIALIRNIYNPKFLKTVSCETCSKIIPDSAVQKL